MKDESKKDIWVINRRGATELIARRWTWHREAYLPSREVLRAEGLDALRARLPEGLTRADPAPHLVAHVVEVWS